MQENRTIDQIRKWLSRESEDLGRLRRELVEKNRKTRQMSEQLRTNRIEAARLDELHRQQLAERDETISELKSRIYELSSDSKLPERDEGGPIRRSGATDLYLDLMKRSLTNWIYRDEGELYQREPKAFEELVREEGRAQEDGPRLFGDRYLEVRYEDLQADAVREARAVFAFLGADAGEEVARRCTERVSFERWTRGRERGQEDSAAFLRKGVAGDWRNVFTPRDKEIFKQMSGDLLVELGYEEDGRW
jgi:hypothetical protein